MFIRMSDLEGMGQFGRGRAVRNMFDQRAAQQERVASTWGRPTEHGQALAAQQRFERSSMTTQSSYDRTAATREAREAAAAERRAKLEDARQRQADAVAERKRRAAEAKQRQEDHPLGWSDAAGAEKQRWVDEYNKLQQAQQSPQDLSKQIQSTWSSYTPAAQQRLQTYHSQFTPQGRARLATLPGPQTHMIRTV